MDTTDDKPAETSPSVDADCSTVRERQPSVRYWHNGPKDGLSVPVFSSRGDVWHAATQDSADAFVRALNSLQESSDFGQQCWQDQCENAYIEASVHKIVVQAAVMAVMCFGTEAAKDAIARLDFVLAGNVYAGNLREKYGVKLQTE